MITFLFTLLFAITPVRESVQTWAIDAELMDARERPFLLARTPEAFADLCTLASRWRDLANAPHLVDCVRLPNRDVATAMIEFNQTYQANMIAQRDFSMAHYWEYEPVIHESIRLYAVWDALRDAQNDSFHVTVRRHALKTLRELIGPARYYMGLMPPPAPLWAFREIGQ